MPHTNTNWTIICFSSESPVDFVGRLTISMTLEKTIKLNTTKTKYPEIAKFKLSSRMMYK